MMWQKTSHAVRSYHPHSHLITASNYHNLTWHLQSITQKTSHLKLLRKHNLIKSHAELHTGDYGIWWNLPDEVKLCLEHVRVWMFLSVQPVRRWGDHHFRLGADKTKKKKRKVPTGRLLSFPTAAYLFRRMTLGQCNLFKRKRPNLPACVYFITPDYE